MNSKLLEIRDCGTRIAVLATRLCPDPFTNKDKERALKYRAAVAMLCNEGYCDAGKWPFVMVTRLSDRTSGYEPYDWPTSARTMKIAHKEIAEKFDELESGDVIDVEFILGERTEKKTSEFATMFV